MRNLIRNVLPLMLVGCLQANINPADPYQRNPETFMLQSTSELASEFQRGIILYSRKGNNLLLEGRDGLGYYNERGIKVKSSDSDDLATYTFDGDVLKFKVNDGSCREEYVLDLNNGRNNKVGLKGVCNIWGALDNRILESGRLSYHVLSPEERDMVEARVDDLMVKEGERALSLQDGLSSDYLGR
jgi:hypothetical protein